MAEIKNEKGDVMGYYYDPNAAPVPNEAIENLRGILTRPNIPAPFKYPTTREELLEFGDTFFKRCLSVAERKNQGYARERDPFSNFRLAGEIGFAVRMSDKVSRLLNLLQNRDVCSWDESIEDTCLDLANYAMLLTAYRSNERG